MVSPSVMERSVAGSASFGISSVQRAGAAPLGISGQVEGWVERGEQALKRAGVLAAVFKHAVLQRLGVGERVYG